MSLRDDIDEVKSDYPKWISNSRIIGRAGEKYCCKNMKCLTCNSYNWLECITNEKSKDQICKECKKKYQIKCKSITQKQHKKIMNDKIFKTIGAEYNTTLKSIEQNIDYIIILYDNTTYKIIDIIHINSDNITCLNIISRNPLSEKAKRKSWQGCNLHFTNFNSILSEF